MNLRTIARGVGFLLEADMFTLFFGAIYVCGFIGMTGVTISQIIEIGKAVEQAIEIAEKL